MRKTRKKRQKPFLVELASRIGKENWKRDCLLVMIIALSVIALFSLSTIARGRTQADSLKEMRQKGTSATAILSNADAEQFQQLSDLNYVEWAGIQNDFGICYQEQTKLCECSILLESDFKEVYGKVYSNMAGQYPQNADEVMLSVTTLNSMGITNPKLGMEIPMQIVRNDWLESGADDIKQNFILSGYYTDLVVRLDELPTAYFSRDFSAAYEIELFPGNILLKSNRRWMDEQQIEKRLYNDVSIKENQRFSICYVGFASAVRRMIGGYAIAFWGMGAVLLSLYLFVYNIESISIRIDWKQYGLLKVIGASPKQIQKLFYLQTVRVVGGGLCIGAGIGSLLVYFVLSKVIGRMFLAGTGDMEEAELFSVALLILSIILSGVGAWIAIHYSVRTIRKMTPISCLYHEEKIRIYKVSTDPKQSILAKIAWRNVIRNRRKFLVTIGSILLGIETALICTCIVNGLDQTNEILQNPDFTIRITKEAVESYFYENDGTDLDEIKGHDLLPKSLLTDIQQIAGITEADMSSSIGSYGNVDTDYISMIPGTESDIKNRITGLTLQVVSDEWMERLVRYVEKENVNIDLNTFKDNNGFLFLHNHELTNNQVRKIQENIGEQLSCFFIEDGGKNGKVTCCGYLDITEKDFPVFSMPWDGNNLNYIIVSEQTYDRLGLNPVTYQVTFDVEAAREPEIKGKLQTLLANANQNAALLNTYEMVVNSDRLAEEESYLLATRLVMGVFSGMLIFLAIINYSNTVITDFITREQEFAIMRKIGMTRKQLRKMLMLEGIFYCSCISLLVVSVGSAVLFLIGIVMKGRVDYFVFQYPWIQFLLMICIFLSISFILSKIELKQEKIHKWGAKR